MLVNFTHVNDFDNKVLVDLTAKPKIVITNLSTGTQTGVEYSFKLYSPLNVLIFDDTITPAGSYITFEITDLPSEFGTIEFGKYRLVSKVVDTGEDEEAEFEREIDLSERPFKNVPQQSNNFGIGYLYMEVRCNTGKVFAQDQTNHTYKGLQGTLVSRAISFYTPPEATGAAITPTVVSSISNAKFDIPYNGEGFTLTLDVVYDYVIATGVTVRIKYKACESFAIQCNIDLCKVVCEVDKLSKDVKCNPTPEAIAKQVEINSLLFMVLAAKFQPNCGIETQPLLDRIIKIGNFDCNCFCNHGKGFGGTRDEMYNLVIQIINIIKNDTNIYNYYNTILPPECNHPLYLHLDDNGTPDDDTDDFLRPYANVAEVLSLIPLADRCRLTVMAYDNHGILNEFWWRTGTADNQLEKKTYVSIGENSEAHGSEESAACHKNSFASGKGAFVGKRKGVVSWTPGTLTLVASAGGFNPNERLAIVSNIHSFVEIVTAQAGTAGANIILASDIFGGAIPAGEEVDYSIIKLVADNSDDYEGGHAYGTGSIAEGKDSIALGGGYAKGIRSVAINRGHAIGDRSIAINGGEATGTDSFASNGGKASGQHSTASGPQTEASGQNSHARGQGSKAIGVNSEADGVYCEAHGNRSRASGDHCKVTGENARVRGIYGISHNNDEVVDAGGPFYNEFNVGDGGKGIIQDAKNFLGLQTTNASDLPRALELRGGGSLPLVGDLTHFRVILNCKEVTSGVTGEVGDTYAVWLFEGCYKTNGGSVLLDITKTLVYKNDAGLDGDVVVNAVDNTLDILATPVAAKILKWAAKVVTFQLISANDSTEAAAPTTPVTDDVAKTFDWTYTAYHREIGEYEYTVNAGGAWSDVTAKPQPIVGAHAAGQVGVRVKSIQGEGASDPLFNTVAFT